MVSKYQKKDDEGGFLRPFNIIVEFIIANKRMAIDKYIPIKPRELNH